MFRQHAAGEWFNLAERNGFKPARALKAKAEAAYSRKQIQDFQLFHLVLMCSVFAIDAHRLLSVWMPVPRERKAVAGKSISCHMQPVTEWAMLSCPKTFAADEDLAVFMICP